ncbi:MAG: ParA family protein [Pseudomonadota bacterium]
MPVIAVINRKGGSGKSTIATHVAARLARQGHAVMLGDVDRQQSSRAWLRRRSKLDPAVAPPVNGWMVDQASVARPPAGVSHLVLDTPGGLTGFELARLVMWCDVILVPVCDSAFDRESAAACHAELGSLPRIASGRCRIGVVGMRIDRRTRGHEVLQLWCAERGMHFLSSLRNTQLYVQCAERGMSLFDLPAAKTGPDMQEWAPVLAWLDARCAEVAARAPVDAAATPRPRVPAPGEPRAAPSLEAQPTLDSRFGEAAAAGAQRPGVWTRLRRLLRA